MSEWGMNQSMISFRMPERPLQIKFRYRGPAVDDGTMPVEDVITALQGFSGAYGK